MLLLDYSKLSHDCGLQMKQYLFEYVTLLDDTTCHDNEKARYMTVI